MLTCSVLGSLLFAAGPVSAAVTHDYLSQITEIPASSGAPLTGPLSGVNSMTVDSGDLWVAEHIEGTTSYRTDSFDTAGAFISQLDQVAGLEETEYGVAVGHSTGEADLYLGAVEEIAEEPEGVVAVFGASGGLLASWSGADTPAKSFGRRGVSDVAVDNHPTSGLDPAAGDVYVADEGEDVVDVFKPEAGGKEHYVTQITGTSPTEPFSGPRAVAVDESNGDVLVAERNVVDVFKPVEPFPGVHQYEFVYQLTHTLGGSFSHITGLAVDGGNGDIYVAEGEAGVVYQFSVVGGYLGRLTGTPSEPFSRVSSVAVNPVSHTVYVGNVATSTSTGEGFGVVDVFGPSIVIPDVTTEPVSNLKPTSVTLKGTVNPAEGGEATCEFEYGTSTSYGQRVPCTEHVEGDVAVPVESVDVTGLQPDTTYHYRLDATNVADGHTNTGEGAEDLGEFTTPGPGIDEESVSDVASTSATLDATIDPDGASTSYRFEYDTRPYAEGEGRHGTSIPVPDEPIGLAEGQKVSQHIQGLEPNTAYYYRVAVESEVAPVKIEDFDGSGATFTTQSASAELALPDGRQWEMVSPPNKHGALLEPLDEGPIQAAVDGGAIAYLASAPTEAEPQGYGNSVSVLSTRGPSGWSSQVIAPPHKEQTGLAVGKGQEYRLFSEDLSHAVVQPFGNFTPLSSEATESTAYLRTDYLNGNVNDHCQESCFQPLVTAANTVPGADFGGEPNGECENFDCGTYFLGASSDLSHIVLYSEVQLTSAPAGEGGLYEWTAGGLQLISVLPRGEEGQRGGMAALFPTLGQKNEATSHAIADDGARILWEGRNEVTGVDHLYLTDLTTGEATVRLDLPQGKVEKGREVAEPQFMTTSGEGSRIFFLDAERLTEDSTAKSGSQDLYEYDVDAPAGSRLTNLTVDQNKGESAGVSAVVGASEDGSYVYFVAEGALEPGVAHGGMYLRHDGTTKLIASSGGEGEVSRDGQWLAFMSSADLTGYNNEDVSSKKPGERMDEEVYLYDAQQERLVCASCNPTGARPVGFEYGNRGHLAGGYNTFNAGTWLAANLPVSSRMTLTETRYQPRYLFDGGRLFFDSNDALVPQDVNGTEDVYEYEPPGVPAGEHACTTSSPTFSVRSGGCVGLISAGTSSEESAFLDASEGGGDVFFLTAAELLPQDYDTSLDVYDAHECTPQSPCLSSPPVAPPPCSTGDSCKAAPSPQPPIFGASGSATFSGAGNLTPTPASTVKPKAKPLTRAQKLSSARHACRKKPKKKRPECEKQARRAYGSVRKAKKSRKGDK